MALVDPVFTLRLLAPLLRALARRDSTPARVGIALAITYLALGLVQRERAAEQARTLAQACGHAAMRPTACW